MCALMIFFNFVGPTHNHSHDNVNNHNDDKTVDVENKIESDNASENNVGGAFVITLARVMSMYLMLTRFLKMYLRK